MYTSSPVVLFNLAYLQMVTIETDIVEGNDIVVIVSTVSKCVKCKV